MVPHSHPLRPSRGQQWPPDRPFFCQRPILSSPPPVVAPLHDWRRSEKEEPWHAIRLVVVAVWRRPHTLPSWRSYSCRGVCVGLPRIQKKFIHILGDLGVGVKLASGLFCQWKLCRASHRPFSELPIDSSVQVWGAPKEGQQLRMEVKNEIFGSRGNKSQEGCIEHCLHASPHPIMLPNMDQKIYLEMKAVII